MEDDWDLQAVVRGCSSSSSTSAASSSTTSSFSTSSKTTDWFFSGQQSTTFHQLPATQGDYLMGFPDLFQPRRSDSNSIEELLNNFYGPNSFLTKSTKLPLSPSQLPLPISPLSVLGGLQDLSPPPPNPPQRQQQQQQQQQQQHIYLQKQQFQPKQGFGGSRSASAQNARSKKRKNQLKRVCQVPAEGLSSDTWSWRKYGQKPIKGSPYPRGYYRCSTSKGCLARKQVERNRSDPGMYILTYTGEHNHPIPTHRNSLAGSTRQKPTSSGEESNKPTCSPPVSPTDSLSPAPEKREDTVEDEDDDELGVSDMAISDDFFDGLDELVPAGDCCSLDHLPASSPFPWLSNSATTTAAGGS